jgi:putative alpha-1,2-mannosidase
MTKTLCSFVPHDQADLMSLYGGPAEFVRRLNYLHDQNITGESSHSLFRRSSTQP